MRNILNVPLTGDEANLTLYIVICVVAVVLIAALIVVSVISRKKALAKLEEKSPELETVNLEDGDKTEESSEDTDEK